MKRKQSVSAFAIRLWKLFTNTIYGKMIEETDKYIDCKFITDEKQGRKWISSPRFESLRIISPDLVLVFLRRT
ncbi:MAG TPA: hypothetical protein VIY47_07745, partial [Ignavibacteriaceae bacterium]